MMPSPPLFRPCTQEAILIQVQEGSDRKHATTKKARVPKNAPRAKEWHIVRTAAMRLVHTCLDGHDIQQVVGIVGRSGSGKTTLAAAVVGKQGALSRFDDGRKGSEVLAELNRAREMFPDGIVWLRVGRGVGTPDRLRELMQDLAKRFYDDVMERAIEAPQLGEDGTSYVRKAITNGNGGKGLRCLVVADDVWDAQVVDKLRETGMRVLITTRERSLVDEGMRVSAESLTDDEAKDLLRASVGLPMSVDLPEEAMIILERCDNVAMYVEFVGRWGILQAGNDGAPQSRSAWEEVVQAIDQNLNEQHVEPKDKRLAILHSGFKYLGGRDILAQELYMALAVLPDSYPFSVFNAAALLFDGGEGKQYSVSCARRVIVILEQWAVLSPEGSELYRMHDAHTAFGKRNLMAHEIVRSNAVHRWTDVISAPAFLCKVDSFTVVSMWRALERVNGVSWRVCRRYDVELAAMNVSDDLFRQTAEATAVLYYAEGDYQGAESLMQEVLDRCYDNVEADPKVVMSALWFCMEAAQLKGDAKRTEQLRHQLEPLMEKLRQGSSFGMESSDEEKCFSLHMFGLCCFRTGDKEEAEGFHRGALAAQQRCNLGERHPLVAHTMYSLGVCLRDNGRLPEAEIYLERTVDVLQARLTSDDLQVAYALRKLACIVRESKRPREATDLLQRSLGIFRTKLDPGNLQVAVTLHELGRSFLEAGRPTEAKSVLREALTIKDALTAPPGDGQLLTLEADLEFCEPRAEYS